MNIVKKIILAGVFVVATPVVAMAATISGTININGAVNLDNSDFSETGNADLSFQGVVGFPVPTGDFGDYVSLLDLVDLTDIDFTSPDEIWDVGGFTFTATAFHSFVDLPNAKGFSAEGVISGNGFDDTLGSLSFTAQGNTVEVSFSTTTTAVPVPAGILLMGTALAGFGVMRRRKQAA